MMAHTSLLRKWKLLPLVLGLGVMIALLGFSARGSEETVPVALSLDTQNVIWYGGAPPAAEDFVPEPEAGVTYSFLEAPDLSGRGELILTILATDPEGNQGRAKAVLSVWPDLQAPKITCPDAITVYRGQSLDLMAGVSAADDVDPAPVVDVERQDLDLETGGSYAVTYWTRDFMGNEASRTVPVTVIDDHTGPEILGVNPISIFLGSTVSYRRGIIVRDDYTENPRLSVDSSAVDLSKTGKYPVIYSARDDAGNETVVQTTITVKRQPKSFVEESVIYEAVDALLATIVTEDMTPKEQVEAVFRWFERKCTYSATTQKTDRLQTAYKMLKNRTGDCYYFYAACSVMLERLGLPEISVERSKNSVRGTRHYWSMVSLDGGETYYHVDTCPHFSFDGFRTCLVTDADLERCNRYLPGYYTMDEGVYPATPEQRP